MNKAFLLSSVACLVFGGSIAALAQTTHNVPAFASAPCRYYPGHIDVEGKYGDRKIGETSIFLPVACSPDTLLFSDIRLKADDQSNREINLGLGTRFLKEDGILGGYVYFDRKRSGFSEEMHSQLTAGAEWLAEEWEVRANGYAPLTDDVLVDAGSTASDPYLSGTGLFVDTQAMIIREQPLYGGDVEAGVKIPKTDLWMHLGGYSFSGDDSPTMVGVRARARYEITENVALTAEGQYDDERGRDGWVGARFTLPFGGSDKDLTGLKARMTASPVRDVDVVTSSKAEASGAVQAVAVLNVTTGVAQRIIYIDNQAAGGGDGSMENPFNNLTDVQAALQDHDVVYIHTGVGSNGMDTGLAISNAGVHVVGAGTDFVYDSSRFTASGVGNLNNAVLIAANAAPTLTNGAGVGITVTASDVSVSGVTVDGATGAGVLVDSVANFTLHDSTVQNSGAHGVFIDADNVTGAYTLTDNLLTGNGTAAGNDTIRIYTSGTSDIDFNVSGNEVTGNNYRGIHMDLAGNATVDIDVHDNDVNNNVGDGFRIGNATGGATNVVLNGNIENNNFSNALTDNIIEPDIDTSGLVIRMDQNMTAGSLADRLMIHNNTMSDNSEDGFGLWAFGGTVYAELSDNIMQDNQDDGAEIRAQNNGVVDGLMDVNIYRNTASGHSENGIQIDARAGSAQSYAHFDGNTTYDNAGRGLYVATLEDAGTVGSLANPVVIENNISYNNGIGIGAAAAVGNGSEIHTVIRNNQIYDNTTDGIYLEASGTANSLAVTVQGNTITGNDSNGMDVRTANTGILDLAVDDNDVTTSTAQNLYFDTRNTSTANIILTSNRISDAGGDGVEFNIQGDSAVTGSMTDNIIEDNTEYGVFITARDASGRMGTVGTAYTMSGNTIRDNDMSNMYVRTAAGVAPFVYISMFDNILTGSAQRGIDINEFDSTLGTNNTIVDMGGGVFASTGGNQIYDNAGINVYYNPDIGASVLKAENNWWGQDADPSTFDEASDSDGANEFGSTGGSTIDASPRLSTAP
ncbi:right-handed parallel beta-helix repeat-containing protein [Micavibrio aeruginosavorus]|uniref:right-handed parallel beta-helix repeat-containing protein n=1 Tax=Micavibrio aeruginosavorus TaxID=349221 RepID=UPI003F4AC110